MKKSIKFSVLSLLSVLLFSCDDNGEDIIEGGVVPFGFEIKVVNSDGENYITEGTFLEQFPNTKIEFKDKVYSLTLPGMSRDNYRFILEEENLYFGLFLKDRDSSFKILWSDGKKDVVAFKADDGNRLTSVALNGVPLESDNAYTIVIVK